MQTDYRENFLSFVSICSDSDSAVSNEALLILLNQRKNKKRLKQSRGFFRNLECNQCEGAEKTTQQELLIHYYATPTMYIFLDPNNPDQVFATKNRLTMRMFRFFFHPCDDIAYLSMGRMHEDTCSESCYKNTLKEINLSRNNVKMVFPVWRMKKMTPGYIWKFMLYYPHQRQVKAQNIVVPYQKSRGGAASSLLIVTARLGFCRNIRIDYSSYERDISIASILNDENRIYLKRRIFLINQVVLSSESEFYLFAFLPDGLKTILRISEFDDSSIIALFRFFRQKFFFNDNTIMFDDFILQFTRADVFIVANVFSDMCELENGDEKPIGQYVSFYFPRSPQKTGEIFDPINSSSKLRIYQSFHNLLSRVLKYGVLSLIKSKLFMYPINGELKADSPILSLESEKKPVFPNENLLNCRIDYFNYELLHRRSFEIYVNSSERFYPVSVLLADLYYYIKKHHEDLKEDPQYSEFSTIYGKRIINRKLLQAPSQISFLLPEGSKDICVPDLGTVILSSWEGAAHFIVDNQDRINKILRVSLYQLEDLAYDLQDPESSDLFQLFETKSKYRVDVEIKDNIEFLYEPAFTHDQFIRFFNTIIRAHRWIFNHRKHILLIHCRSGIGRGAIFTTVLWYYSIAMHFFNSPQCLEIDVSNKCRLREEFLRSIFKAMLQQRMFINFHKRYLPFINYVIEHIFEHRFCKTLSQQSEFDVFQPPRIQAFPYCFV